MRYAQGGGLTAEGRRRRELVRLEAARRFEQRVPSAVIAAELRVSERPVRRWHPAPGRRPRLGPGTGGKQARWLSSRFSARLPTWTWRGSSPPMSLPDAGDDIPADEVLGCDAVWLMAEHAAPVVPGFAVDAANAGQVLACAGSWTACQVSAGRPKLSTGLRAGTDSVAAGAGYRPVQAACWCHRLGRPGAGG